jgi:hypothetical protein
VGGREAEPPLKLGGVGGKIPHKGEQREVSLL